MNRLEEIKKALEQLPTREAKAEWALNFGIVPVRREDNSWSPRSPLGYVGSETFRGAGPAALEQLEWLVSWGLKESK